MRLGQQFESRRQKDTESSRKENHSDDWNTCLPIREALAAAGEVCHCSSSNGMKHPLSLQLPVHLKEVPANYY
jgi:hypothetical protein